MRLTKLRTPAAESALSFKVDSLANVDKKMLARIEWPADVKALRFYPRSQADGLYQLIQKNIPTQYEVRLAYKASRKDIRVPEAPVETASLKVKPFRDSEEMLKAYVRTVQKLVKAWIPRKDWSKSIADGRLFHKSVPLGNAFRVVSGKSVAGLMLIRDYDYGGRPATIIGWVWIRKTLTIHERRQVQRLMLGWLKRRARPLVVAGVDGFNAASQGFMRKSGFAVDRLSLTKPRTTLVSSPGIMPYLEWAEAYARIWKEVENANYGKAISLLTPLYNRYPRDFKVAKTYAMALGDYAECLKGARRTALKNRSRRLLLGLLKKMGNLRWEWNISARNEYYYHTGQFRKQYLLGREAAAGGRNWGYYGQGVGAANYAYEHALTGRRRLAAVWASRAIIAWESFMRFKADYYNAYVHYALALGILGRNQDMAAALKKSGMLSGKPDSYREFAEVREKVSKIQI